MTEIPVIRPSNVANWEAEVSGWPGDLGYSTQARVTLIGCDLPLSDGDTVLLADWGPVQGRWTVADAHNPERVILRKPEPEKTP